MDTLEISIVMSGFDTTAHLRIRVGAAHAFMPAALLNAVLLAALWLAERLLPPSVQSVDALHVLSMAAVGGLVYALCFLYLPIPALASETVRWKTRLKLAKAPA